MIKRHEYMNSPSRVVAVEVEPAVPKGDNYMSDMIRATMVVRLQSGATVKKSVIIKRVPDSAMVSKVVQENRAFYTEIDNYKDVFPAMERLMDEFGDRGDKLWCKCLDYTPYSQLVLEDLKEVGFRMADRKSGMDMDHAVLTVRSLAKFHALGYVLIERGSFDADRFLPSYMGRNEPRINDMFAGGFKVLAQLMRNAWEPKWASVADKLEVIARNLGDRLHDVIIKDGVKFKVLNHGDCWVNNIMYKYDSYTRRPISIRFVDFQGSHYNTPALDLIYMIYSSLRQDVKRDQVTELLRCYCTSLARWVRSSGHTAEGLPGVEDMEAEMRRLTIVALAMVVSIKPLMKTEGESMEKKEGTFPQRPEMYEDPEIEDILKEDIPQLLANIKL
ncbi:hypothetical protein AAG570_000680 [Ranatra chinensis]|uniref:CHK kinase-like domain-containing protein n=1 Tax=Ranatra chinensis TaxID=642074 RepID=A0ABD0YXS5_9HEMI